MKNQYRYCPGVLYTPLSGEWPKGVAVWLYRFGIAERNGVSRTVASHLKTDTFGLCRSIYEMFAVQFGGRKPCVCPIINVSVVGGGVPECTIP